MLKAIEEFFYQMEKFIYFVVFVSYLSDGKRTGFVEYVYARNVYQSGCSGTRRETKEGGYAEPREKRESRCLVEKESVCCRVLLQRKLSLLLDLESRCLRG